MFIVIATTKPITNPKIIPRLCANVIVPALTNPIAMIVVAALEFVIAVIIAPKRVEVT